MSRETWAIIRQSKHFYVDTFRRVGSALLVSMVLNLCLGLAIYMSYFSRPEHDFYATSGITPPVSLTPRDTPNNSSQALLASNPDGEPSYRVVPP